jgi:tripartite-type tricarboxylate transporter receptor subunit TctC
MTARCSRLARSASIKKYPRIGVAIGAALTLLAPLGAVRGEENFPNRPIRLIVPYSVGSVVDVFGRIVAANMAEQWKGTILNESKSGGNGTIAAEEAARAAPDGYTWMMVTTFFTASPSLNVSLKWDPVRDFIPIGQICTAPNFFVVPKTLPATSVKEFVALAREKPGKLNYGHPGKGSTGHLGFELFKKLADIDVSGIGYRGYPQMTADLSTGLLTATFLSANQALAQAQTGTIRIIAAINSDGRSKYFPDVPTMAEQGYPGAQVTPWFGIVVPKGTPEPIVDRISKALDTALANPDVQQKLDLAGCPPKPASRAEFAGIIKNDIALWAKVVKDAGIPPD